MLGQIRLNGELLASHPSFSLSLIKNLFSISFSTKALADDFGRMEFYSRVLHSLQPDTNNVWRANDRLDAEIRGWPKWMNWVRIAEKEFRGTHSIHDAEISKQYATTLSQILPDILVGVRDPAGRLIYRFSIGKETQWLSYSFNSKARTIAALCVLFDLTPHSRNDLELNVPENSGMKVWPPSNSPEIIRTYGDPSKTADVLRNEGWQRIGKEIGMKVFRQGIGRSQQQMYQLLRKEQHLGSQVMRTNIPRSWRLALYQSQDYTCQICHTRYPAKYLEPDHRIPVITQADELTKDNFKEKLMTLCRYCNQVKREACKVLPADYDWTRSPWAYPEKYELEKIKQEIETYAKTRRLSKKEVLRLLEC